MTPMLEQYVEWKDAYPDCLLFFRMGDFYEMFFDDAEIASSVLDIALTSRSKENEYKIPMAGVPYHSVDSYLGRLIAAGYRVAICEQITEPDGKGLLEREVTRVVTPGTWLPENSDDGGKIAACLFDGKSAAVALLEPAGGALRAGTFSNEGGAAVMSAFMPDEILLRRGQRELFEKNCPGLASRGVIVTECEKGYFAVEQGAAWLCRKWGIASLSAMGLDDRDLAAGAAAAAVKYLEETQFSNADNISSLTPMLPKENLVLDQSTQANLELADKGQATLFWVLNRCRTPMGRRALKEWITSPLQDLDEISRRQDMIETLAGDGRLRAGLAELLSRCRDMGKSLSRLTLKMGLPYDVQSVGVTLGVVPEIVSLVSGYPALARIVPQCDTSELAALLRAAVADNVPRFVRDGGVIRSGFDAELDEWRDKAAHSSEWLARFEESERERTGIKNLKAGVNKVFGYYIEIPKASASKAPMDYVRKQTLVGAERFITEELKRFEHDMFRAEGEILAIEERIYARLVGEVLGHSSEIQLTANFISALDVLLSLAAVASERGYTRPTLDMSKDFIVKNARHPVIEVTLGKNPFTPNDFNFSAENGRRIALITGPNMAGKSTYLRTAALIAIMAHMGSFVPAESAKIGLIDRVFTRIGARDELARGQSTFMVEMVETAKPSHPRRSGPRHIDLRRPQHRMVRRRIFAGAGTRAAARALRDALPRADAARRPSAGNSKSQHGRRRKRRPHSLPAQDNRSALRPLLRHRGRAPRGRPLRGAAPLAGASRAVRGKGRNAQRKRKKFLAEPAYALRRAPRGDTRRACRLRPEQHDAARSSRARHEAARRKP